jgi:hypothetical protein
MSLQVLSSGVRRWYSSMQSRGSRRFRDTYCLHRLDDGGSTHLWNIGLLPRYYTGLHHRNLSFSELINNDILYFKEIIKFPPVYPRPFSPLAPAWHVTGQLLLLPSRRMLGLISWSKLRLRPVLTMTSVFPSH